MVLVKTENVHGNESNGVWPWFHTRGAVVEQ